VLLLAQKRRIAQPRVPGRFDARVYALTPANAAFLQLPEEALTPVHTMQVYGDDGAHLEFDAYRAGVAALAYIVEDAVLQDALWEGLDVREGQCEALSIEQRQVRLHLEAGGEIAAKLVIGADGARSRIRQLAGIDVRARPYGQSAVVANFACERPHRNAAYQWFQGGPVLALLPLPGNHVSMVWSLPTSEAERVGALDAETLCREVESATAGALGTFALVTPPRSYALQRSSARRMVAPRLALVGDAAHVIHPLAGQGLNLGLQDARALLEVLQAREPVRDPGDERLLRRYERARAEPILAMDTTVDTLYRLFAARGASASRLRNEGLNLTNRLSVVKNILIRQAMN